jgi:ECF sigma factor
MPLCVANRTPPSVGYAIIRLISIEGLNIVEQQPHSDTMGEFSELVAQLRLGDAHAACELVSRYESIIRVAVRVRCGPELRRQFDSMDVCQSVFASFFIRVATGAFDLHQPKQLVALLTKMAQNKLNMRTRGHFRECRDIRRHEALTIDQVDIGSRSPGPLRQVAGRDLLEHVLDVMSPEIRAIAQKRMRDSSWSEIASTLGGTAEGRRKQFERAVDLIGDRLDVSPWEG